MATRRSRITAELDLDRDGKQLSWLRLPYSSNVSAYGWIPIPICVIRNGDGPTVLLTAGIHGDEYEGQVALTRLIRQVQPDQVSGRLIVLPCVNWPAGSAGLRCSPIDGVNLNRAFPGDADGSVTAMIAHYLTTEILPLGEVHMDLHSGGNSLLYLPSTAMRKTGDAALDRRADELFRAFGAPVGWVMDNTQGGDQTVTEYTQRAGNIWIGTELGGAGIVGIDALRVAERGIRAVMERMGVLAPSGESVPPTERVLHVGGPEYFVYASDSGVFEPFQTLGTEVRAGQAAGAIHFVDDPARPSREVRYATDGLVVCQRALGRCSRGDCLAHLAGERPA